MMKRIRYTKLDDGTLASNPLLGFDNQYVIRINPKTLVIHIESLDSTQQYNHDVGTTMHELKKEAKALMQSFGVQFLDEVRGKRREKED